jgi:glycosyltransferase involved in cell wall biosynthesis
MDKVTILFIGTQMEVAGSQKNLLAHAKYFHRRGHDVTAAFFYDKQGLHTEWQAAHDFPIINLKAWQPGEKVLLNLFSLSRGLRHLVLMMRENRPQVVETFTPDSNLLGLSAAWLAGVPVRIATHRAKIDKRPDWYPRLHGWAINRGLADKLIAVSEQVRQLAVEEEGIQPERIIVIPNGVEVPDPPADKTTARDSLRGELALSPDAPLLLTVGRLTEQKGHRYLLEAAPAVLAQYSDAVFAFAGEGPLRDELAMQAEELGITQAVRFLGLRRDVPQLLCGADVFVLPSLWEGMSMALLEAMSEGAAVVASDVEGINDLMADGCEGLVVPPADPQALAQAILRLLKDADLRKRLGKAARGRVKRDFSVEAMCEKYEEVLISGISI